MSSDDASSEATNEQQVEQADLSFLLGDPGPEERSTLIFVGEVNEENGSRIVLNLLMAEKYFSQSSGEGQPEAEEAEPDELKFFINTEGGSAYEMFAIFDVMEKVKKTVPISTIGIGKVMSAGVILLAAGTRGHRKVGKNTRIMIHNVITGQAGAINVVEHELKEVKRIQEMYINCLAENSDLTAPQIKRMLKRNENIYISAEEAIEYGIADQIL